MVPGRSLAGAGPTGRTTGRLRPHEVAEAAVLADVSVALCLLGWLLPFGYVLTVLSIVPMAVLGARHRARAVAAGGFSGIVISLLLGGTGLASNLLACAVVGVVVGAGIRRSWGQLRTMAVAVLGLWPLAAGALIGALALFDGIRRLVLHQVVVQWRGAGRALRAVGLPGLAHLGDRAVPWLIAHWPIPLAAGLLVAIAASVWLTYRVALPVVHYMAKVAPAGPPVPLPEEPAPPSSHGADGRGPYEPAAPIAPVPIDLRDASFRYPGASANALRPLSGRIDAGRLHAVVGPNGSGKSTLVRLLAGAPPTGGSIDRPGRPGLGQPGGTALVFQHPERQVLGVRVRDDVVWGLPADAPVSVERLLERVGLNGMGDRETSTLSGGELQRLALAAALARRPALLLSDESTAMIDPEGRQQMTELLASAAGAGAAVVHVTHRPEEAARADRTLVLGSDALVAPGPRGTSAAAAHAVQLRGVGYVYGARTPWEHRALVGVDLDIGPGEGILVVGRNGSGKSTLAWVVAGLLVPTEGEGWLDGQPLHRCVGRVGLAFQHARLQLLRPHVRDDVQAAAGVDREQADAALRQVGLDPLRFGARRVDELSGGQQRRVALAGVLATRPPVLVLDEPFAGMDATGRADLIEVLARLRAETGTSLVVVSHDTEGAERVVDRAVTLDRGRVADERASAGRRAGTSPSVRPAFTSSLAATDADCSAASAASAAAAGTVGAGTVATSVAARDWATAELPGTARAAASTNGRAAPLGRRTRPGRGARAGSGRDLHLLRPVPGDSPVHRLWAGTKLIGLLGIALTLSFQASWAAIATMTGLVAVGLVAGRIPLGARPRLPVWFWAAVAVTATFPLLGGGPPLVHLFGTVIGLGGLATWARLVSLALLVLLAAALVSWTTPLGEVAPALGRLGGPARRLRLPVDEWAATLGLGLRSVPLLLDEVRMLIAVMRLRAAHRPQPDRMTRLAVLPGNLLVATLVVGIRRAREMGTAIDARGGLWARNGVAPRRIADEDRGPGWRDLLALAAVAGAIAVAALV